MFHRRVYVLRFRLYRGTVTGGSSIFSLRTVQLKYDYPPPPPTPSYLKAEGEKRIFTYILTLATALLVSKLHNIHCLKGYIKVTARREIIHSVIFENGFFFWFCKGLTSQLIIFQSCRDGTTASWVLPIVFGEYIGLCSRR